MEYQAIVEYRPKLRACQFFLKANFNEDTTEIEVQNNFVFISDHESKIEIKFPDLVNHITDSVSNLHFTKNSLCFRTRINPDKTFGSFNREVLLPQKDESVLAYKPSIKIGEFVQIYCKNCLHPLSKEVIFDRVLPLPLSLGAEDFFCHFKISTDNILFPRLNDCLFGLYYYKVNISVFEKDILDDHLFKCPTCANWLGTIDSSSVQLWNATTLISDIVPMASNDTAVKDFLLVIQEAISEKYNGTLTNKLVLECSMDFENGRCISEYILIWIMENNLQLLTSKNGNLNKIVLEEKTFCKLLYLYECNKTKTVSEWLESPTVSSFPISKNMFTKGLEYLKDMSQNIPQNFRTTIGMNISYVEKLK